MQKLIASTLFTLPAKLCLLASRSTTDRATPLFHAVCRYHHAAHELGNHLLQPTATASSHARLAHCLIESSDRFMALARNPSNRERFAADWVAAQSDYQRILLAIEVDPVGTSHDSVRTLCARLRCSFQILAGQMSLSGFCQMAISGFFASPSPTPSDS